MSGRKRVKEEVKELIDDTTRLIDKGADKAGQILDRGMRKLEEGASQADRPSRPAPQGTEPTVGQVIDDTAVLIGRAGKKVINAADRGIQKASAAVESDAELKRAIDKGVGVVDRVVEKGVDLAKKGIRKTEEILEPEKKRRGR